MFTYHPVLWIRNVFFGSGSDFLDNFVDLDATWIFSINLNINFTFVFSSSKCVRFHSTTRYCIPQASMGIFVCKKGIYIVQVKPSVEKLSDFYQIFREVISNSFWIRSWPGPDSKLFFRIWILLNVSDPAESGSCFKFRICPDPAPDPDPQHWLPPIITILCTEGRGQAFRGCDWSREACYDWLCAVCLHLGKKSSHTRSDQCSGGPTN